MTTVAPHRVGQPSPLTFHMGAAASAYQQAVMAALNATDPAFPWHEDLQPFTGQPPHPFDVCVEAAQRLRKMCDGIRAWQTHPYRREEGARPVIWSEGATRLIDFGPDGGRPVVIVPSLINKPYILDLMPDRSFLQALAAAGYRPLLLDWGIPGSAERALDLEDYRYRRLTPALAIASVVGGGPPALIGYCMGGTLGALHVMEGAQVSCLVTIGAPWDFSAGRGNAGLIRTLGHQIGVGRVRAMLGSLTQAFGMIPVDVFQQLFAMVNPMQAALKFRRFADMDQSSAEALHFVALEDWLADGVPMAGPAAENLLIDWQLENRVSDRQAAPGTPSLVVSGQRDTIAPPQVAMPLAKALGSARALTPDLGHVGMITGGEAPAQVWAPVVEFLRETG